MKDFSQDWHSYILLGKEVGSDHIDSLFSKMDNLRRRYEPISQLQYGNLIEKNCAKSIVKKKNQSFIEEKTGHRYAFFFQCQLTGRMSKVIPIIRLSEFGILKGEEITGSNYPDKMQLENKFTSVNSVYYEKVKEISEEIRAEYQKLQSYEPTYRERYYEYLNSEEWKKIRSEVLERDAYRCQITGAGYDLQVHHIHYNNIGNEDISDLITLCGEAHSIIHNEDHLLNEEYQEIVNSFYLK
jgi:hypothetical protein